MTATSCLICHAMFRAAGTTASRRATRSCEYALNGRPYSEFRRSQSTRANAATQRSRGSQFPMPKSQKASPYDIFHLSRQSSSGEIKARYYELVKIFHPDRALARQHNTPSTSKPPNPNELTPEKANEDFKRIREAYSILSDEGRRRVYDRSGLGWDPEHQFGGGGGGGFRPPVWKGGFPKTAEEREAYEAWSSSLRRGSPGSMNRQGWQFRGQGKGHDKFGWQTYAGDSHNLGSDWFYGYGHSRDHANTKGEPMYTSNERFFLTLTFLTTILGIGQFIRLREESKVVIGYADRRHKTAAASLDEARNFAKSDAGKVRYSEMRKRAREFLETEEDANVWKSVGIGGPSGRGAYEERLRRIGRSLDDDVEDETY
ncbi:hypothetical protein CBS101457_001744 [Exobasidium rhododendri]|nr:hypothetical protein CBS101457_001744 [Exobasidium rhododendri]